MAAKAAGIALQSVLLLKAVTIKRLRRLVKLAKL